MEVGGELSQALAALRDVVLGNDDLPPRAKTGQRTARRHHRNSGLSGVGL